MFVENFYYEIDESASEPQNEGKPPYESVISNAENWYLTDKSGKKYLDLTSNNEHMPLGFSINQGKEGFYDSVQHRAKNFSALESLIAKKTGLSKSLFFQEKQFVCNFLEKAINEKPQKLILKSVIDECRFNFPGKEVINIPLNDESAVKTFLNKNTAAVIIQIAQIKENLSIADTDYLKLLKENCTKNNTLLIYDTCSISPLRLNRGLFNFNDDIKPDCVVSSRGLAAGNLFYLTAFNEVFYDIAKFKNYTGIFSSAYAKAINFIENSEKNEHIIKENSKYIEEKFLELQEIHIGIADVIPYGMMYELVTEIPSQELARAAFEKGLILTPVNEYTVLICPPYNIDKKEIDRVIGIFDNLFDEIAKYDRLDNKKIT